MPIERSALQIAVHAVAIARRFGEQGNLTTVLLHEGCMLSGRRLLLVVEVS